MLQGQIEELSMSKNNIASGLSITIIEKMEGIVEELWLWLFLCYNIWVVDGGRA